MSLEEVLPVDGIHEILADLLRVLRGRAAGFWWCRGDSLELAAFVPAPDMPGKVVAGFTEATRSVSLREGPGLGIVAAARMRFFSVSESAELPPDSGSGYWLLAFE